MFAEDLQAHFTTHPGLSALIAERFYPVRLPQNPVLPAVVYQQVGGMPEYSQDTLDTPEPRMQFTVWAGSYKAARDVTKQVTYAAAVWADVREGSCFVENALDLSEPETKAYLVAIDLMFHGVTW